MSLRRKLNRGILQPTCFINRYSGGSREVVQGRVHAVPLCCSIYSTFEKGENLQQHHYKINFKLWKSTKQLRIILTKSSTKLTILYSNSITVNAWIIEYKCPSLTFNKEVQTRSVWFMTAGQRSLPSQLENCRKEVLRLYFSTSSNIIRLIDSHLHLPHKHHVLKSLTKRNILQVCFIKESLCIFCKYTL